MLRDPMKQCGCEIHSSFELRGQNSSWKRGRSWRWTNQCQRLASGRGSVLLSSPNKSSRPFCCSRKCEVLFTVHTSVNLAMSCWGGQLRLVNSATSDPHPVGMFLNHSSSISSIRTGQWKWLHWSCYWWNAWWRQNRTRKKNHKRWGYFEAPPSG